VSTSGPSEKELMLKVEILSQLRRFKTDLSELRRTVRALESDRVSRKALRDSAEGLATRWVEELRSPLEHTFQLPAEAIHEMSDAMKQLHVLSRPNNRKDSYLRVLETALDESRTSSFSRFSRQRPKYRRC